VTEDVSKVLECEAALPLTALIGPNIIIGRSFDSPEAAIAMNFVRATGVQQLGVAIGTKRSVLIPHCFPTPPSPSCVFTHGHT
jgi:hypothetical protein